MAVDHEVGVQFFQSRLRFKYLKEVMVIKMINKEFKLSGKIVRRRINGRIVEFLTNPKTPTITWEELVKLFRSFRRSKSSF